MEKMCWITAILVVLLLMAHSEKIFGSLMAFLKKPSKDAQWEKDGADLT